MSSPYRQNNSPDQSEPSPTVKNVGKATITFRYCLNEEERTASTVLIGRAWISQLMHRRHELMTSARDMVEKCLQQTMAVPGFFKVKMALDKDIFIPIHCLTVIEVAYEDCFKELETDG